MPETRDLLREAVGSYAPRGDEEGVLRRVERRRRRRRAASGVVALGLVAAMGVLAWSAFGSMGGTPGAGDRPTFVLSAFDVDPHVDPETGDADPDLVDVTFTAAWSSSEYPGAHRCDVRLSGPEGLPIGSRSLVVSSLTPSARQTVVVPVRGSIEGVTGSCGARRLDEAVAVDVTGERFENVGAALSIAYEMVVTDGGRIGAQACTSAVWDADGDLLGSTGFVVLPAAGTQHAELGVDDAIARAQGDAATVTCAPYARPDAFPDPEPPR
jgi:hypothetical protein